MTLRLITSSSEKALPPFIVKNGTQDAGTQWKGLLAVDPVPNESNDYIARELNIFRDHAILDSKVKAYTDPATWLSERKVELEKISNDVAAEYSKNLAYYYSRGYSASESTAKATQVANMIYAIRKQEMEASMPGSSDFVEIDKKDYKKKYKEIKANKKAP